ncbi:ankyrin repeat domain-containing protein [Streptomyces sp. NPDC058655]|uniref:ankyrin repeat domain-containing protein n=1 Tax=Streptomyces sp. NPDC058655 TaxID=3346577 RepID=UPI003655E156
MKRRVRKRLSEQLVAAAGRGDGARVAALLRAGAEPGDADAEGTTALYAAAVSGHSALVRMLLARGADPDAASGGPADGTPLCAAASWGDAATVRELLAHGADPGLREDGAGMSPLEWAVRGGHADAAGLLRGAVGEHTARER